MLVATAGLCCGVLLGFLLGILRSQRDKTELIELRAALTNEHALHASKVAAFEHANQQMAERFAALSKQALQDNNELFLKLADQNLQKQHNIANNDLAARQKSIETLIKPIHEALQKTEQQLHSLEKQRQEAYGSLKQHLHSVADTQVRLQRETQNLVSALRRPEVRGQWGEMTLQRLVELAGMSEHCDFYQQHSVTTEDGVLRPDMLVRMPDQRELVIDAKTPLDAYLTAVQTDEPEQRAAELRRHARKLRERVKELASKSYWLQFKQSPDYVVLFIPGEQFLSAALEQDPELLEYALSNKVILTTPTSLIALLRAVAFGWRQQDVAQNADKIQRLGEELYGRLLTFIEHLSKIGAALNSSVEHYNRAVGSLEHSVLPGARKFTEMGIKHRKTMAAIEPLEKHARQLPTADAELSKLSNSKTNNNQSVATVD